MRTPLHFSRLLGVVPWLLVGLPSCSNKTPAPNGSCAVSSSPELECISGNDGGLGYNEGLVGYSCTGTARPDDHPQYIQGVPQGLVCADKGILSDGTAGYCCSGTTTPCAYDPVAACQAPLYGYQCRGADRPEALNSDVRCAQGNVDGDLIDYCCASNESYLAQVLCVQDGTVTNACGSFTPDPRPFGLLGFICPPNKMPLEENLGQSASKADFVRLLCSVPMTTTSAKYPNGYCCFSPAPTPEGASCVQDSNVPNCPWGNFGFACYGPDTPEQDYPPMNCHTPPVRGSSAEGYPANLYCCSLI